MKIIFKEVGQGDSIIIEWEEKSRKKIGIIDCNLKDDKSNPILNYIATTGIVSIDFIILSHPHYDHYSGMNGLLNYCELKKIQIDAFLHTSASIPESIKVAIKGHVAKSELSKLFLKIDELYGQGLIKNHGYIDNNTRELILETTWKLKFLNPTYHEFRNFNKKKYKPNLEVKQNNSVANLLSTLIKIYNERTHVLLTSDTVGYIYEKIEKEGYKELKTELIVCQIPHHGSKENFYGPFWKNQINKNKVEAAISVGENDYGHPSKNVLSKLKNYGYNIQLTNSQSKKSTASSSLDIISTSVASTTYLLSQDIVYFF